MRNVVAFTIFIGLMIGFFMLLSKFRLPYSIFLLIVIPVTIVGTIYVYMTFFIGGDFFPMPWGRASREYKRYVQRANRGEERLERLLKHLSIPPPLGDEALRDKKIEDLILSGDLQTAEDRLSEKVQSFASNPESQGFRIYSHYLQFLLGLRRKAYR